MTTKIDLHSHSLHSDGSGTAEQMAAAAKAAGLDALCVSDHHSNIGPEVEKIRTALLDVGVLPIIACEYSTKQGHLQVFGVDVPREAWSFYPEMQTVIDEVNALGGACVVPHAYKRGYKGFCGDDIFKMRGLAGMEGYNGQVEVDNPGQNALARAAATKLGLPMTGASDAHRPSYVGLAYTLFEATIIDERDFIAALKSGRFTAHVNEVQLSKLRGTRSWKDWPSEVTDGRYVTGRNVQELPKKRLLLSGNVTTAEYVEVPSVFKRVGRVRS